MARERTQFWSLVVARAPLVQSPILERGILDRDRHQRRRKDQERVPRSQKCKTPPPRLPAQHRRTVSDRHPRPETPEDLGPLGMPAVADETHIERVDDGTEDIGTDGPRHNRLSEDTDSEDDEEAAGEPPMALVLRAETLEEAYFECLALYWFFARSLPPRLTRPALCRLLEWADAYQCAPLLAQCEERLRASMKQRPEALGDMVLHVDRMSGFEGQKLARLALAGLEDELNWFPGGWHAFVPRWTALPAPLVDLLLARNVHKWSAECLVQMLRCWLEGPVALAQGIRHAETRGPGHAAWLTRVLQRMRISGISASFFADVLYHWRDQAWTPFGDEYVVARLRTRTRPKDEDETSRPGSGSGSGSVPGAPDRTAVSPTLTAAPGPVVPLAPLQAKRHLGHSSGKPRERRRTSTSRPPERSKAVREHKAEYQEPVDPVSEALAAQIGPALRLANEATWYAMYTGRRVPDCTLCLAENKEQVVCTADGYFFRVTWRPNNTETAFPVLVAGPSPTTASGGDTALRGRSLPVAAQGAGAGARVPGGLGVSLARETEGEAKTDEAEGRAERRNGQTRRAGTAPMGRGGGGGGGGGEYSGDSGEGTGPEDGRGQDAAVHADRTADRTAHHGPGTEGPQPPIPWVSAAPPGPDDDAEDSENSEGTVSDGRHVVSLRTWDKKAPGGQTTTLDVALDTGLTRLLATTWNVRLTANVKTLVGRRHPCASPSVTCTHLHPRGKLVVPMYVDWVSSTETQRCLSIRVEFKCESLR